ncbi:MAG TPA: histidine kinase [Bacteroidales bacterium]|nr:histidine kinase [Bacteroidales bacterium]
MQHPVFLNRISFSIYFGLWALIMGVHFSIFYFVYYFPIEVAIADSFVFNALFCVAGISMWFVVRYSIPDQKNWWNVILNHLSFLTLILVVWNGLSYTLLSALFSSNKVYMDTLMVALPNKIISGTIFYLVIALCYYLYIYYVNLRDKIKVEARLRMVLKETELNMLKSQINPHFLFNSLNSISSLTITNPEKAQEMIIKLSDFLRYSVSNNTMSFTTLDVEMANIRRYLEIEKVRFGDKLMFSFDLQGSCTQHQVPVMLLQPLFENAIKHGVYESTEQVSIEMDCEYRDGYLEIRIVNDFDPTARPRKGTGIGLNNIRERLGLLYKNDKLLRTEVIGTRFCVYLSLPVTAIEKR